MVVVGGRRVFGLNFADFTLSFPLSVSLSSALDADVQHVAALLHYLGGHNTSPMLRVIGLTPLCAGLRGSWSLVFCCSAAGAVGAGGDNVIANGLSVNSVARGDMRASPNPSNIGSVTFSERCAGSCCCSRCCGCGCCCCCSMCSLASMSACKRCNSCCSLMLGDDTLPRSFLPPGVPRFRDSSREF